MNTSFVTEQRWIRKARRLDEPSPGRSTAHRRTTLTTQDCYIHLELDLTVSTVEGNRPGRRHITDPSTASIRSRRYGGPPDSRSERE